MLIVLEGPNKSRCKSSRALEVEIIFLTLKETLDFFYFLQASQRPSFKNLSLRRPLANSLDKNMFKWCMWIWATLLCHSHDRSSLLVKQVKCNDETQSTLSV